MSFTVRLLNDLISTEAGGTASLSVEVANRSDEQDQFELEVEGLDPDWVALPVPHFSVEAHDIHSEKGFLKPPRVSESQAGEYPFVVKVRSLISGESRVEQGVLQIKPFHYITLEASPKKGYLSVTRRRCEFSVAVANLGNTEHKLQIIGSDPEDACVYQCEQDVITVGPGQQKHVTMTVSPKRSRMMSSSRLHGFSVTARSVDTPSVMASAQAQVEQRPLVSPGAFLGILFFAIVFGFWVYLIPKPPGMLLQADSLEVTAGQPVAIQWAATNATSVTITINGRVFVDGTQTASSKNFVPEKAGMLLIEGYSARDAKESEHEIIRVKVDPPPVVDDPHVEAFTITPSTVNVGQPFLLNYKLSDSVVKAVLQPTNQDLDPKLDQLELTRTTPGVVEFKIVAQNSAGKVDSKTAKVTVVQSSDAVIVAFDASPSSFDSVGGVVQLSWQLSKAVRAELDDGKTKTQLQDMQGSVQVPITKTTTFTLTAYDDKGLTTKKVVKVKVASPPPTPTDDGSGGGLAPGGAHNPAGGATEAPH